MGLDDRTLPPWGQTKARTVRKDLLGSLAPGGDRRGPGYAKGRKERKGLCGAENDRLGRRGEGTLNKRSRWRNWCRPKDDSGSPHGEPQEGHGEHRTLRESAARLGDLKMGGHPHLLPRAETRDEQKHGHDHERRNPGRADHFNRNVRV